MTHKWFKGNMYLIELDRESKSFIKFTYEKKEKTASVGGGDGGGFMNAFKNAKKALEYDDEISEHDESHSEGESPKSHIGFQITGESSYQKLPIMQEIKVICLHFGAIVHDVL